MLNETFCTEKERLLAILCDNNHVYVYNVWSGRITESVQDKYIQSFEFDRNDQKRVSLVKSDSTYVVLDNYVFEMNGNKDLTETHFSPIHTIAKKDDAFIFVGEYDNSRFAAIVGDGNNASLWNYES